MSQVYDAGALIALERGDPAMWLRWHAARGAGEAPRTHGGVVGQVWRGGARQAWLGRALPGLRVADLGLTLGKAAGELMRTAGTSDVVDAALVAIAFDGDRIFTSDIDDLTHLADTRGLKVDIVRV